MQNRYAGDIGDFGKLGLLRFLAGRGFGLGVNWYLVDDEVHNADGKHTSYLTRETWIERLKPCDEELFQNLSHMVLSGQRSVRTLESMNLIPGAGYYSQVLHPPGKVAGFSRRIWHEGALLLFEGKDLVFLDPDNGLMVKSVGENSAKSVKYVLLSELEDYYRSGHSIVFYNHRSRQKEEAYLRRFRALKSKKAFGSASLLGLRFRRGPARDFFFILQKRHSEAASCGLEAFLTGPWGDHWGHLTV